MTLFRFSAPLLIIASVLVFAATGCSSDEDPIDDNQNGPNSETEDAGGVDATDADGFLDADDDMDTGDVGDVDDPEDLNACGGREELHYDGEPIGLGESCGECGGVILCDGPDAVRCVGGGDRNSCGGCDLLPAAEGDACGPCGDGVYECNDVGGLECVEASERNLCGGCEPMEDNPGEPCDEPDDFSLFGVWVCDGSNDVECEPWGDSPNQCGFQGELEDDPGSSCGPCGGGTIACDETNGTFCVDEDYGVNACGGCEPLPDVLGEECGPCGGEWVCDGEDALRCDGGGLNGCGGCGELDGEPGDGCDDGAAYQCQGFEDVQCAVDGNPCGGESAMAGLPGSACGDCGNGEYVCATEEKLICVGATPPNVCGGCSVLPGEPGEECDYGGQWACDDEELVCEGSLAIMVLDGEYDDTAPILDELGLVYDTLDFTYQWQGDEGESTEFLQDIDQMMEYDVIIVESSNFAYDDGDFFPDENDLDTEELEGPVTAFVEAGNTLYVSGLNEPLVSDIFPEMLQFPDGADDPRMGTEDQTVEADVLNADLEDVLEASTVTVEFPLGGWPVTFPASSDTTTYLSADAQTEEGKMTDVAMLMSYSDDDLDGTVIYTPFYLDRQEPIEVVADILSFLLSSQ